MRRPGGEIFQILVHDGISGTEGDDGLGRRDFTTWMGCAPSDLSSAADSDILDIVELGHGHANRKSCDRTSLHTLGKSKGWRNQMS